MKLAITAQGPRPDSPVDDRFGRAYWILIRDEEAETWEAFENGEARNAVQWAGIRAAQAVSERGVDILLTGVTGPKAFRALEATGIRVYHGASGTAETALRAWREGRLAPVAETEATGKP